MSLSDSLKKIAAGAVEKGKDLAEQGKQVPAFAIDGVQWNWQNTSYGFKDKNYLLPIPLKELELNPNMQPNAGW